MPEGTAAAVLLSQRGEPCGRVSDRREADRSILDAADIFPEQFAMDDDRIVLSFELFSGEYDYTAPHYEFRCSLPDQAGR